MSIPLSLVVCTRNRVDSLRRCVQALVLINTDYKWELIIVDNGSDDGTSAYLASLPRQLGKAHLITTFEPKRGLGTARNKGLSIASGDIIAFTDDDCYVFENYIDSMISAFANPEIGVVGGRILLYDQSDLKLTIAESEDYLVLPPRTFVAAGTVQGANMAFRRAILDQIGGFDENLGAGTRFSCEDIDAVASILWEGYTGAYDPRPTVYHHHGRKTKYEARDLMKTYDKGRGAYYIKFILRSDSRSEYIIHWLDRVRRGLINGSLHLRLYSARQSLRELFAGLHYVAARVFDKQFLDRLTDLTQAK
ncbi:MAG: glycosyltransferase family 2 protein [Alphaproteobacteria bacterium]|nr:glycosyltransferase family 2 protein [Alphaproteobacteria bacterium]